LGTSVLLTTHYLEEAERLCDRVAIIHKGEIRAIGKTRALIEEWSRKKVTVRLRNSSPGYTHPDLVKGSGREWNFLTKMNKPLGELLQELQVRVEDLADVQVEEGRLEDVFRILTKEESVHA
jgi:ABC-2 type transport system ATP-binding protein